MPSLSEFLRPEGRKAVELKEKVGLAGRDAEMGVLSGAETGAEEVEEDRRLLMAAAAARARAAGSEEDEDWGLTGLAGLGGRPVRQ